MPTLSIKPDLVFQSSTDRNIYTSDADVGGFAQGKDDFIVTENYQISFSNIKESEAQTIVNLIEEVNYTQPFTHSASNPEIPSGEYLITPNSVAINILTGNSSQITFQIERQNAV
jgi:hypothetical protein